MYLVLAIIVIIHGRQSVRSVVRDGLRTPAHEMIKGE